jgi:hypothetical protein
MFTQNREMGSQWARRTWDCGNSLQKRKTIEGICEIGAICEDGVYGWAERAREEEESCPASQGSAVGALFALKQWEGARGKLERELGDHEMVERAHTHCDEDSSLPLVWTITYHLSQVAS